MSQRGRKAKTKQAGGGGAAEDLRSLAGSVLAQVSQTTRHLSQGLVQRSLSIQPGEDAGGAPLQGTCDEDDAGLAVATGQDLLVPSTHPRDVSSIAFRDAKRDSVGDEREVPPVQHPKDPPQSTRKGLRSERVAAVGNADHDAGDHDIADQLHRNTEMDGIAHVSTLSRAPSPAKLAPPQNTSNRQHQQHLGAEPRLHNELLTHATRNSLHQISEEDTGLGAHTSGPARLRINTSQIFCKVACYITPTVCFLTLLIASGVVTAFLCSRNNALALSQELVHADLTRMQSIVMQLGSRLSNSEQVVSSKDEMLQAFQVQLVELQVSLQTTTLNMSSTHSQLSSFAVSLAANAKAAAALASDTRNEMSEKFLKLQSAIATASKAPDASGMENGPIGNLQSCDLRSLQQNLGPLLLTRAVDHSPVVGDAKVLMKFYHTVSKVSGQDQNCCASLFGRSFLCDLDVGKG